jgi:HlyD family secretion protein
MYNWYTGKATALDAEKYRAALAVAEAQLVDAEREVERLKNGPTADDIDAAQARVAAAQSTLNQSRIIAPFDGVVTQAEPMVGDLVSLGAIAFRVEDLAHLYVDLEISEVDINSVAVGQPVDMVFDAVQGKTYNGRVIKVNQSGDATAGAVNFVVTVELTDDDKQVKPGMTAAVTITVKEIQNTLIVPNRAVRVVDGNRVVYILVDGQPVPTAIRLGAASDSHSEVVGGDLKEGDQIVLNPPVVFEPGPPRPGGGGGQ